MKSVKCYFLGEITIDTYLKYIRKMYAFEDKVISYHERDTEIDLCISLKDYESNSDSDSEPSASANSPDSAEEQNIIDQTIVSGNNTVRTANMTLEDGDEVTQTQFFVLGKKPSFGLGLGLVQPNE